MPARLTRKRLTLGAALLLVSALALGAEVQCSGAEAQRASLASLQAEIDSLQAQVDAGGPDPHFQLVGYTQATYQGDTTLFGLTRACQAEFPESRLCSSVEIMETVDPDAAEGLTNGPAWTQPAYVSRDTDASGRHFSTNTLYSNCSHWSNAAGSGLTVDENGVTRTDDCSSFFAVACCALVP